LRKATIRFVMSAGLSVRMEQPCPTRRIFHEIWNLSTFRKPVEKTQVSLKSDKNNRYLKTNPHFWSYLAQFFVECELFQTNVVEEIKTHFMFNNFFLSKTMYEIMWENAVDLDRPQMMIRRMRFACWTSKTTNTHSGYEILIAFLQQQWLCECASVLRFCVHGLSFIIYFLFT